MQRFITDPLVPENDQMDSIQQGILCLATEHRLFDNYQIGVNPDVCVLHIRAYLFIDLFVQDEYRITDFGANNPNDTLDGRQFYVADVEEHFRPSDDLLRDHYRTRLHESRSYACHWQS